MFYKAKSNKNAAFGMFLLPKMALKYFLFWQTDSASLPLHLHGLAYCRGVLFAKYLMVNLLCLPSGISDAVSKQDGPGRKTGCGAVIRTLWLLPSTGKPQIFSFSFTGV